jgi:hypothetical protein
MGWILKSAASATWITVAIVAAIALLSIVPPLNVLAFWIVEAGILIVYFVTKLPVGTAENEFLMPNPLGFTLLITLVWFVSFLFALLIGYANRGKADRKDAKPDGCYACGSTGFIRVGSSMRVCGVCEGHGR